MGWVGGRGEGMVLCSEIYFPSFTLCLICSFDMFILFPVWHTGNDYSNMANELLPVWLETVKYKRVKRCFRNKKFLVSKGFYQF